MFDIPDSVTSIGNGAFSGCSSLTKVTIPDNVTSIGDSAFSGCSSLTNISVNENNQSYKSIDGNLYTKDGKTLIQYAIGKSATSFVIPDSVTSIGDGAFADCSSLTSVTIPDGVTSISSSAFSGCSSLTSITIPDSVTSIGSSAFYNCGNLKQLILFPSSPPTLGSNAIPATIQSIYVQQSYKAAYQTNWNGFGNKIVSDNIYLSFVRFNQKNKEYIDDVVRKDISGKQDKLSTAQLNAVNSGITSSKVSTYDGYATSKQDKLTTSQLNAVNSGITSSKVSTYDGYATSKQNKLSTTQLNAVNSGITSSKVSTYDGYSTSKQNKLTAGTNITLSGSTISAANPSANINVYRLEQSLSISPNVEATFSHLAYAMDRKKYHIDLYIDCSIGDSGSIMVSQIKIKRGTQILVDNACRSTLNAGGGVMCSLSYDNTSGDGTEKIYPSSYNYTSSSKTFRATLYIMEIN